MKLPFKGFVEVHDCKKGHVGGETAVVPYAAGGCHPGSYHFHDVKDAVAAKQRHNDEVRARMAPPLPKKEEVA